MRATGLRRSGHADAFYTDDVIALQCLDKALSLFPERVRCVEPSAGGGAFLRAFERRRDRVVEWAAVDVAPAAEGIMRADFLQLPWEELKWVGAGADAEAGASANVPIAVVGNPPFGRQSSLARRFLAKSAAADDVQFIAVILPRSFKKPSMQKAIPRVFTLALEWDIPVNAFRIGGEEHHVPCVFQVWRRGTEPRSVPVPPAPRLADYTFVPNWVGAHLALRRVGVFAGRPHASNLCLLSPQSHYFVRLCQPDIADRVCRTIAGHRFPSADQTVGPKSVPKADFITVLNQAFEAHSTGS